tara:strand:+ start:2563 stop:4338 length:1776 start_codon:yes stop_codon:yes gene_type:complete
MLKIMTCGSVDDGKSTLLGRILYETNNVYVDNKDTLDSMTEIFGTQENDVEYAFLLDGLIDEREQGITIDIAFKYFKIEENDAMFIDSPGHIEFTRNMANAATFANIALLMIDVKNGLTSQTEKHLEIVHSFNNIKKIIVCINKIDSINYKEEKIESVIKELNNLCSTKKYNIDHIIPISGLKGDNIFSISKNYNKYNGSSLYDILKSYNQLDENLPLFDSTFLPVYFSSKRQSDSRYFATKTVNGNLDKNSAIKNIATNEESKIKNIYHNLSNVDSVKVNQNIMIELESEISVSKGDVFSTKEVDHTKLTNAININAFWINKNQFLNKKRFIIKFPIQKSYGFFSKTNKKDIKINDFFSGTLELEKKLVLSDKNSIDDFSRFTIIEPDSKETVGFGYVNYLLDRGSQVFLESFSINESPKNTKCIWFTGLPSSGKTTLARELSKKLSSLGISAYVLDGDNLRSSINKDLGFSQEDRIENNRRTAHIAKILHQAGVVPIVATISPNKSSRDFAKSLFDEGDFLQIYLDTPLEVCIDRDVKNLYNSKTKKVKNITGIHSNYDIPENPNLKIDTSKYDIENSISKILKLLNID